MNISLLLNQPSAEDLTLLLTELSPLQYASLNCKLDKFVVHKIAKIMPVGAIAVEVGTYLGATASIMAHANENLEIHAFDLFDDGIYAKNQDTLIEQSLGKGQPRSLENVSKFVSKYKNIHLHKVVKNETVVFKQEIDFLIEDSSHRYPQLSDSMNNWLPKIKINGIVMLHDYRPYLPIDSPQRFLDVENYVDFLSNHTDWKFLGGFGDFAIFQRTHRQD